MTEKVFGCMGVYVPVGLVVIKVIVEADPIG